MKIDPTTTLIPYLLFSVALIILSYRLRKSQIKSRYTAWMWEKVNHNKHTKSPDHADLFFFLSKHVFRAFFFLGFLFAGPIFFFPLLGDIIQVFHKKRIGWKSHLSSEANRPIDGVEDLVREFPGMSHQAVLAIITSEE